MSSSLFEVLSLAARYLFSLMGVIIVLRSFAWLLAERSERHRVLRTLPDAGTIGELVVLEGSEELPAGLSIPVPWEGVLGSVRSCDIVVPCPGVRKRHLTFSWETGTGLTILPCSGCEAQVDGVTLNVRTREKDARPMVHGSFLKVGSALLRLRVFAGLDTAAGFHELPPYSPQAPAGDASPPAQPPMSSYMDPGVPAGALPRPEVVPVLEQPMPRVPESVVYIIHDHAPGWAPTGENGPLSFAPSASPALPAAASDPGMGPDQQRPEEARSAPSPTAAQTEAEQLSPNTQADAELKPPVAPSRRKRRMDRWEADWSE